MNKEQIRNKLKSIFKNMTLKDILSIINEVFIYQYKVVDSYESKMQIDNIMIGFDEVYDLLEKSYYKFYGEHCDDNEYLMDFTIGRINILTKDKKDKDIMNSFIERIVELITSDLTIANTINWKMLDKIYIRF